MDTGELFLILIVVIAFFVKICYSEYRKGVKEAEEEERQARLQRQREREQKEELAKIINAAITTQVSSVAASSSPIVGEIKCPQCGGTKVSEIGQGRYKVDTSASIVAHYSLQQLLNRKKTRGRCFHQFPLLANRLSI